MLVVNHAGTPPPGVHPSPDGAEVAAPVSIIEWLINFYEEARTSKVGHLLRSGCSTAAAAVAVPFSPIPRTPSPNPLAAPTHLFCCCCLLLPRAAWCWQRPPLEVTVRAGEVLYVPRGCAPHAARVHAHVLSVLLPIMVDTHAVPLPGVTCCAGYTFLLSACISHLPRPVPFITHHWHTNTLPPMPVAITSAGGTVRSTWRRRWQSPRITSTPPD